MLPDRKFHRLAAAADRHSLGRIERRGDAEISVGGAGRGMLVGAPAVSASPGDAPAPSRGLVRFQSEAEFRRYLEQVRRAQQARQAWSARMSPLRYAQADPPAATATDAPPVDCPPEHPECLPQEKSAGIVVTGSRISPHNSSITNNQTTGVDEGDIVKQAGQYLLILQDGRLFSVDTRPGGAAGLAVVDRLNVYRSPEDDGWYDEMLVSGDRVLVTGYSYEREASEYSIFRIDRAGRLTSLGTFYLGSGDYYSSDNYATRLVGDRLVIYTPMDLADVEAGKPLPWPRLWRWRPGEKPKEAARAAKPLFTVGDIYRPVLATAHPVVHAVSVCRLNDLNADRDLSCRTTGFVGPYPRELYVSPTHAFLWTMLGYDDAEELIHSPRCTPATLGEGGPAAVYRLPLAGDEPDVIGATGYPVDHFALEANGDVLRALLSRPPGLCGKAAEAERERFYDMEASPDAHLSFFSVGMDAFAPELEPVPASAYTALPDPGSVYVADRFTDHYLVYGGMSRWGSRPPEPGEKEWRPGAKAFAVPFRRPSSVVPLPVEHTINRVERVGDDVVMSGYRDASGLELSYLSLRATPRVSSTVKLDGRYESEGRSHAFNSLPEPTGGALMGIPTVVLEKDAPRWWFRSAASDVSFLQVDPGGALASLGPLATSVKQERGPYGLEDQKIPGYVCEVSCVDWYGNTRPIFTEGRVFALTGAELIEGKVEGGAIREVRRLLVAGPSRARSP